MSNHEQDFVAALRDIMGVIGTGYDGMIIGGMAVIALGYPRVTTDIDATVLVNLDDLPLFFERLKSHGIVHRIEDPISFAKTNHVLLMRHQGSGIDIDISIAMLPFEEDAISNSQAVDFAGVKIAIPRAEDMIIYKMVACRPEDLRDVEELLLRYRDRMNLGRIREIVAQFAEVLDRSDMLPKLDSLISRSKS